MKKVRCRICGGETYPGLDLGGQPVGGRMLTRAELRKPETLYPLQVFHCADCGLTQLGYLGKRKCPVELVTSPEVVGVFSRAGDLDGVMKGIVGLLKPTEIVVIEDLYWLDTVLAGRYGDVCHEHLRYWSLRPLQRLLARFGMEVIDVRRGGTWRVSACFQGAHAVGPRVAETVEEETAAGLYDQAANMAWAKRMEGRRLGMLDRVWTLVREGKKVIGIGAGANASTVCNYGRLGPEMVDYIADTDPMRAGKFLPGVHIPIVEEEKMFSDPRPADAAVVFGWTGFDETVARLRGRGWMGEVIPAWEAEGR